MNTFSHPVKKNNFEVGELKVKKKKAQKSERRESKKIIDKMISEDQEIEKAMFEDLDLEEDAYYYGIDWGFSLEHEKDLEDQIFNENLDKLYNQ